MQNIGEKLEEARKRHGISIREAAEATKIRGDFIVAFENNSMDIPLPEVYIRGFLTSYARFLKLDPDKIITDYDAMQLGRGKVVKKDTHDFLGRMDLPESEVPSESSDLPEAETAPPEHPFQSDKALYIKVGLIFGGTFLLVFLIVILVNLVVSRKGPELNPELGEFSSHPGSSGTGSSPSSASPLGEEEIILIALDDVNVVVRQKIDNKQIFNGMLAKGDSVPVRKMGPVRISFLEGDNLIVEKAGQKFEMGKSGPGTRSLE